MPVYAYCRGTDTLPLEAQQRRIAEEVMRNGSTVDMTVIEHNPRSIPLHKRREGKRLLRRLQPDDIVVVAAFTCIFASFFEARKIICDFRQRQISLRLLDLGDITDDKTSKMFLAMLSAFGDLKTVRGGRIRAGKAKLRAEGKYQGGKRPFGWQVGVDRTLVPDPVEQTALVRMRELRTEGKSLRETVTALQDAGVAISLSTVHRILNDGAEPRPLLIC
jgi:DNA invertase Pin-like site-specific DNA recombinase